MFAVFKISCTFTSDKTNNDMTTQEINIAKALFTAKEMVSKMITNGFGETKFVFALSNMISKEFNLTQSESIIIIEQAIELA